MLKREERKEVTENDRNRERERERVGEKRKKVQSLSHGWLPCESEKNNNKSDFKRKNEQRLLSIKLSISTPMFKRGMCNRYLLMFTVCERQRIFVFVLIVSFISNHKYSKEWMIRELKKWHYHTYKMSFMFRHRINWLSTVMMNMSLPIPPSGFGY